MAIQVYHGSEASFNKFEFKFIGSNFGTEGAGFGFYFSESKADALCYGPILYTCVLNLKTNVSNTKITLNYNQIKQICDKIEEGGVKSYYENWNYDTDYAIKTLLRSQSDTCIIGDIVNAIGDVEVVMRVMCELGYTHTTDQITPEDETITHYIVYDQSAIKIIKQEPILV